MTSELSTPPGRRLEWLDQLYQKEGPYLNLSAPKQKTVYHRAQHGGYVVE